MSAYVKYLQGNMYVAKTGVDNNAGLNNMDLWGIVTFPIFVFDNETEQTAFFTSLLQFNNTNNYTGIKELFGNTFGVSYDSLEYPVFCAYANGIESLSNMPLYPSASRGTYNINPLIEKYALTDRYDIQKTPNNLRVILSSDIYYTAQLFTTISNGQAIQGSALSTSYTHAGQSYTNISCGYAPCITNNFENYSTSNPNLTRIYIGIISIVGEDVITKIGYSEISMTAPNSSVRIINPVYTTVSQAIDVLSRFAEYHPKPSNEDPYEQGGTSTTGGGTGNFDLSSDAIDFPGLPTLSAVSTGLISLYTPTITQLNALASYLWNADVTTVDWWKKLVANPLDLILGLSIVPVAAPQGASNNIKVGLIDTGVSMPRCASQYVEVDCGSLNVSEFWGSALDYAPFRKHSIYLPFIGTRSINTDDIMGKTVSVVYHIDLLSGAATAMIKAGDSVLYQYSGACAISVPLSGQTFTDMITSTIQLAAAIGATVATGGAAAGITAASAANSVMSMKPTIERAGGVSGAAGQLGIMTPYLIGEIPRQSVPENYNQFAGYPSNIKSVLGELSGYTEVETVYLTNIIATSGELGEIESLLKQGVFINES